MSFLVYTVKTIRYERLVEKLKFNNKIYLFPETLQHLNVLIAIETAFTK